MLVRVLLFLFAVSAAAVGTGYGQPSAPPLDLPESCLAHRSDDLAALEKQKAQLELAIARASKAKPGTPAKDDADTTPLSRSQEDLLDLLFRIDCAKARQELAKADSLQAAPSPPPTSAPMAQPAPPPPPVAPGASQDGKTRSLAPVRSLGAVKAVASAAAGDALEVTTYFATNRGQTGDKEPGKAFDANVASLTYGRAVVSIPSTHTAGHLELPSIWKLQLRPDPTRHFVLKAAVALSADDARAEMTRRLTETRSKSLLVFVHGYNMSFAETAMRTAQLAYDLKFPGLPFFFSWPSAAQYTAYLRDAESAQLSEDAFDQVLDDLSRLPVDDIYIIAHSMGSRVVSQVLKSRVDRGKPTVKISDLLLAAPDINADLFRTVIAPRLKTLRGTLTTIYASSSDLALRASKAVHGYARVGETADGVAVFPGLDTVDASGATMAVRAFGHSYLTDSAAVLKDIGAIVRQKLSAKQRGLAQLGASPNIYWSLPERR